MTLRSLARSVIRRGPRTAVLIPEWAGFGNQLYYCFYVHRRQEGGEAVYAVRSAKSEAWLTDFPLMRDALTIARSEFRWSDRVDATDWVGIGRFGIDYSRADLHRFLTRFIVAEPSMQRARTADNILTVNIRRGDYYSDPAVRGEFSIDQPNYLSAAMDRYLTLRPRPDSIRVVSDDLGWCAQRLTLLNDFAGSVSFDEPGPRPIDKFSAVATAHDLVITNSTFSIWGGHVSTLLSQGTSVVIAPAFSTRPHRGRWAKLDPGWTVIEDVPGGWDS